MHRELYSIEKCIMAEHERLRGHSVLVLSDAMAAVAYINKCSGPSDEMTKVMKRIFRVCVQNEISLRSEHLTGVSMKEAGVDALSRWGEFTVRGDVFKSMQESPMWGKYAGRKGYPVGFVYEN